MNLSAGPLIILGSTFLYSFLVPLIKKVGKDVPPFTTMAVSMLTLALISIVLSLATEKASLSKVFQMKSSLFALVIFGVINAVAFWLLIVGSKYLPAWQVTMFNLLSPMFAGIIAYFLIGEKIAPNLFIGLIIASLGIYIAVR